MIPRKVRALVVARAGQECERCGLWCDVSAGAYSLQHRVPRGMGGTKRPDTAVILAFMCGSGTTGCHGWAEHHILEAYEDGWRVPPGMDPDDHPILHHGLGHVLLLSDGSYQEVVEAA